MENVLLGSAAPEAYELLLLAPNRRDRAQKLGAAFLEEGQRLGLTPSHLKASLSESTPPVSSGVQVALYLGGSIRALDDALVSMLKRGCPVLPVVELLANYTDQVPTTLAGVNGLEDDGSPAATQRILNAVFQAMGLLREQRRVFISYRRRSSNSVALQLAPSLSAAGYQVFLDTWSIGAGKDVQVKLNDSLADTDIVLFLDTPGALDSRWVANEFARANMLGVTILHLVWPGHSPQRETEVSERLHLMPEDFISGSPAHRRSGRLRQPVLHTIVQRVEALRTRSFAHRRQSLTHSLTDRLDRRRISYTFAAQGAVRLRDAVVVPVVGHPDSRTYHQAAEVYAGSAEIHLLFQGLGLDSQRRQHLDWLDRHLPVSSLSRLNLSTWIRSQ